MEYYLAIKRNEILLFVRAWRMDLGGIMLNEISQTEKDKYHMFSLYAESKEQNKQTKQRQTHR